MFRIIVFIALLILPLTAQADDKVMARIAAKGEINCGVYTLGSIFSFDPAGKPQGFTVDLMTDIAARAGIHVKYTEVSSFATLQEDMNGGKFDMICAPILLIPATAMKYLPSIYITADPINIYADATTDLSAIKKLSDMNDPKYTFVGMDNELGGIYVPKLFPKAKLNLLAMGSMVPQMFMEVHTKKANFVVLSRLAANAYQQQNPGKLKQVTNESLLYPSIRLLYPKDSPALKANIDAFIEELQNDGTMDKLLQKHGLSAK